MDGKRLKVLKVLVPEKVVKVCEFDPVKKKNVIHVAFIYPINMIEMH